MEIKIEACSVMSGALEHDIIKIHPSIIKATGLKPGGLLTIRCFDGSSVNLKIAIAEDRAFAVSRHTYRKIKEGPYKTTLGCDPEFVFIDVMGRVCSAETFLQKSGEIGCDGPLGELRPKPGEHEDEVIDTLRGLIKSLPSIISNRFGYASILKPEGHSEKGNLALGFHIHLGVPKELTSFAAPRSKDFFSSLTSVLDYFVGIPALLPEDTNSRRLGDGNYGSPGDWRSSQYTVEYRTPGGFHLRHPGYARGILGLALCAGSSILSWAEEESQSWTKMDKVHKFETMSKLYNLPNRGSIRSVFFDDRKDKAFAMMPNIIKSIEKMPAYSKHSRSIKEYLTLILENKQFQPQLLSNW